MTGPETPLVKTDNGLTTAGTSEEKVRPKHTITYNFLPTSKAPKGTKSTASVQSRSKKSRWSSIEDLFWVTATPVMWLWYILILVPCRSFRNSPKTHLLGIVFVMTFWALLVDAFWILFCRIPFATSLSITCMNPPDPVVLRDTFCAFQNLESLLASHGIHCVRPEDPVIESSDSALKLTEPVKVLLAVTHQWRSIDFHMEDIALTIRKTDVVGREDLATRYSQCGKDLKVIHGLLMEHINNLHQFLVDTRWQVLRLSSDFNGLQGTMGWVNRILSNHAKTTYGHLIEYLDWIETNVNQLKEESNGITGRLNDLNDIWRELNLKHGEVARVAERRAYEYPLSWRSMFANPTKDDLFAEKDYDTLQHIYTIHFPSVQTGLEEARNWLEEMQEHIQRGRLSLAHTAVAARDPKFISSPHRVQALKTHWDMLFNSTYAIQLIWSTLQSNAKHPEFEVPKATAGEDPSTRTSTAILVISTSLEFESKIEGDLDRIERLARVLEKEHT